jgi:hypothetical protein
MAWPIDVCGLPVQRLCGELPAGLGFLSFGKIVIEPVGDDAYATIVIRSETSCTGYHTDEADCKRLYRMVVEVMWRIAK